MLPFNTSFSGECAMSVEPFSALACPLDGKPLNPDSTTWRCPDGHSFDVARQGYVNLLPVQNKRSLQPGDSKEMVAARQRFLNGGHYRPVAEAVHDSVFRAFTGNPGVVSCLDAGCGEGYYLRELATAGDELALSLIGLDISKWATLASAKQDKRPRWVVGSNASLPILPGTLDCILCLFGFPVYSEFARVLKPGGVLLQVDAGPDHLRELREIIYPSLKPEKPPGDGRPDGFSVPETDTLGFALKLESQGEIADLLAMTPHLYRAPAEGLAKASQLEALTVTVDVRLNCFRR
jgi:23S rRNA (guanine745-N1)-methyltransferase